MQQVKLPAGTINSIALDLNEVVDLFQIGYGLLIVAALVARGAQRFEEFIDSFSQYRMVGLGMPVMALTCPMEKSLGAFNPRPFSIAACSSDFAILTALDSISYTLSIGKRGGEL